MVFVLLMYYSQLFSSFGYVFNDDTVSYHNIFGIRNSSLIFCVENNYIWEMAKLMCYFIYVYDEYK